LFVDKVNGKPVTEQDVNDRADEAERGYDVDRLSKRGRKPLGDGPAHVVPMRIDETLLAAVTDRAERDHVSLGGDSSSNPCLPRVNVHDFARKHGVDPGNGVQATTYKRGHRRY
jgi:hypothetical protein